MIKILVYYIEFPVIYSFEYSAFTLPGILPYNGGKKFRKILPTRNFLEI